MSDFLPKLQPKPTVKYNLKLIGGSISSVPWISELIKVKFLKYDEWDYMPKENGQYSL